MLNLSNKNIVITGASSGIGYELAKQLTKEGANLALLARRKNILDNLAEELQQTTSRILTIQCDVTSKENVKSAFDLVKKEFGSIDIAVLNAGVDYRMEIENFNIDRVEEIFNVNLRGLIYCVNELVSYFIERRYGYIVGISSLAEVRGFPKSAAYCSSKAAVSIFLEAIRVELERYNVKVITVKPGFVKTKMTDKNEFKMPFIIEVDKAIKIILKGLKKEKTIIQFPLPKVLGAKFIKILPPGIFDFLFRIIFPPHKLKK